MKSARPSSIGFRREAPVKSETEKKRPSQPGSTNGVSPAV